jgi:outer membrane protein insertion porin family
MKKKILAFFLTLFCFTLSFSSDSFENCKIGKVNIIFESSDPESTFDSKKIIPLLKTQENDLFSQIVFDADLKKLSDEFDQIKPDIKNENGCLQITLHLWPKRVIASIQWEGNKIIKTSTLQKELGIKPGQKYGRDDFNKALNKVKELYVKKGFFESDITYKIENLPNKNEIQITINIFEGKTGKIQKIIFKGFTSKEEKELQGMIYSQKHNFFLSWMTGKGIFRQDALEQDQMTIMNFLNNKGYADAKVEIKIFDDPKSNGIILEILADRGIIYHIGKVTFSGNKLFSNEEIQKKFKIHEKELFSPENIRDTAQEIKDLYGQKGYIETQVFQETLLCENEPIYNVHFNIDEGEQFKIGLIRVFGNTQTNTNVILRESVLVPGKYFDSRRLKATQQRLENIGYFKNVNVYAVKSADEKLAGENYRDVYIEVEETTTGSANLSLGFSSLNDVFGSFELVERNFNIKGLGSIFSKGPCALRGAGEYANAKATIGTKQRAYFFTWMDPYFRDTLWRLGFEISGTTSQLQSKDYRINTVGGSLFTSYPITNYWTYGSKYRLRHSKTLIKHHHSKHHDSKHHEHHKEEDLSKVNELEDNHGLISAISSYISYDSTDNPYKSHRGLRSLADIEFAGLGGDFYFLKFSSLNSLYIPLWTKGTLKFRAELRFMEPVLQTGKDDLPMSELFFLGGETTVRGYKPYILGPKLLGKEDDPAGGISSALFSVEFSHSLFKLMDVFAFFDSGSISEKHFDIPYLNCSVGVGTRLELMNKMPITIGYGIPINPDKKSDEQRFFFSMGGQF